MRVAVLFTFLASPGLIFAVQPPSRIAGDIDARQTFTLKGNTRPVLASAQDQGAADGGLLLPRITLHLAMTPEQNAALLQLLDDQVTRGSARWHQWLTPEEFAEQFGLADSDIQKIAAWLQGFGFSNIEVAHSRTWISFSGTAAQVQAAFQSSIHRYLVNGQAHYANATNPILPKALEGMVLGIRGLHDFHPKPLGFRSRSAVQAHFTSNISGNHFLTPDDWATIYDVKALYAEGITGSGIKIAIPGQTDISLTDIEAFRTNAGLPKNDPQIITSGPDPGTQSGDEGESDLDIEWAGGIAKNATIVFVTSKNVVDSESYIIDNNVAPVLSITYGDCESDSGTDEVESVAAMFQQANAQGMTVTAASGDQGPADCESSGAKKASQGYAVDVPASIPYVTGMGGTTFNEGSGTYWSGSNNANNGSALSYIPETAWNDTAADGQLSASGGGKSIVFSKPSWQAGTGVPYDGARDVPDLAVAASPDHDGYLICSANSCVNGFRMTNQDLNVIGGTSAASPTFAAIVALLNQKTGERQGNINPTLYALASTSTDAFHDVVQGNNSVPCTAGTPGCAPVGYLGYSAGIGYDLVTGLGSIDAYHLLNEWNGYTPHALAAMPGADAQLSVGADGTAWGLNANGEAYFYNAQSNSWTSGSHDLSQIAVGSSGAIWGLDSSGGIWEYNSNSQTWTQIPGNLSQIAVGADGAVWGINSSGFIYVFDSQTQMFNQIPGVLSQIAVGFDGAVWGLNPSQQIFRFNPGTQSFQYVAGGLQQISVGSDGEVWGINSQESIYHFDRLLQGWQQTAGTLKAISVGAGNNVWGLNPESDLFTFNSGNNTWSEVNAVLRSVSASGDGSVWGLDYSGQVFELVQPTQATHAWHWMPGSLNQIAVSSDGDVWGINSSSDIYTFNPLTQNWTQIGGQLSQIAIAAQGAVWGINSAGSVYRFNASSQRFEQTAGNLSQIAVADNGDVWGINGNGQIYQWNSAAQDWNLLPGSLAQIAVGADGDAWGVNSENTVYHFDAQSQSWNEVAGTALAQIAVGSSANVWGLDANGFIWRWNTQTQAFENVPGALAQIHVAFDGAVWGINSAQAVYRFDSQTQSWVNIPGALLKMSVGADQIVWGINAGGAIYRYQ